VFEFSFIKVGYKKRVDSPVKRIVFTVSISLFLTITFLNNAVATDSFGEHEFGMRTRFQQVNDNWLGDARAFTTRLKITSKFTLDEKEQWSLLLEPNYVHAFNDGDYNSVTVKNSTSPIPDPKGFNWSEINLQYASDNSWHLKVGRQTLGFDNERFVGKVEFWQTPQRFDAFKFDYNDQLNWHVQYAFSNKVHRIFGQDATSTIPKGDIRYGNIDKRLPQELGEHGLDAHLANVEYTTEGDLAVVSYAYLLDNKDYARFSTITLGLRISDEFKPNKLKYRYTVEFASQQDRYENPADYRAWYSLLQAGIQYKSHRIELSQEILSEDNMQGFITPFGTNHKFQGWADAFTGYGMQTGLKDQYITYQGRNKKLRWRSVYHVFKNYQNGAVIGNELDFELAYRPSRKWELKLVYADYRVKNGLYYFPKANNDLTTWFVSIAYNI